MAESKNKIFKNIGIALVVFLTMFFLYFIFSGTNGYKKEIKSLNHSRDSLSQVLSVNYVHKDSILFYLNQIEGLNLELTILSSNIIELKKELNEKKENNNFVFDLGFDSNLILFTKFLSEKGDIER